MSKKNKENLSDDVYESIEDSSGDKYVPNSDSEDDYDVLFIPKDNNSKSVVIHDHLKTKIYPLPEL